MENLIGKEARLPHGQHVVIEQVEDGIATVRRVNGKFKGKIAVIAVEKLLLDND
jgi:hypothetical protein